MDDINYLLKNSEKDQTMVILDSSTRDKYKYPSPSEYVVTFTEPFRFVYGFDIIDATIPSTMYSIDDFNNELFFTKFSYVSTEIDKSLLYQLFSEKMRQNVQLYKLYHENKKIEKKSIAFIFELPANIETSTTDNTYIFFNNELKRISNIDFEMIIVQNFYNFVVDFCYFSFEIGNYNIITLQTYLKKYLRNFNIDVRATTTDQQIDKQMKLRFVHFDPATGDSNPFFFDMKHSSVRTVLGFDQYPDVYEKVMYTYDKIIDDNDELFLGVRNVDEYVYNIIAPGVVNLLGVRYLTLRCPEIESHLLGSIGYGLTDIGLGIFKLPSPYETANLKFDFFNFVKKPFHPIGKLNKLSIRFERDRNVLYNFRGSNHHILIVLKYYVPVMNNSLSTPILNPDYNPDF